MSERADRDALVEVLGEHSWDMTDEVKIDGAWTWVLCCECGEMPPMAEGHQHIADAILASDWLAQRDRRVAAAALREAAEACRRMADQAEVDTGGKLDRWDAFTEAEDWCLMRADRIEAGDV